MCCSGLPCIYWQIYPLSTQHRCLEYHYTKLGRSTGHMWQIYPLSIKDRCLAYHYTKLGRSTGHMWQIYWQIYPPSIEHRYLAYCYTKLGRSTGHMWQIYPPVNQGQMSCIPLHQTWQIYWSYVADLLADLPTINRA